MQTRTAVTNRTALSEYKKMSILEKTEYKCARCGKTLSLKTMTVEHIVPISKGGTYEDINLIALCYGCNKVKRDYVVSPRAYYNFIPADLLKEIQTHYNQFLKDVPWYGRYNYTREDKKLIPYRTNCHGRIIKTKKGYMANYFPQNLVLEKVLINTLGEVMDFVKEYNRKFDLDESTVNEQLWEIFRNGCIYTLSNTNGIICVLPFSINAVDYEEEKYYRLTLSGIICKYKKPEYASAIASAISYVTACLSETNDSGLNICDMLVHTANPFNNEVLYELKAYKFADAEDPSFKYYRIRYIVPTAENKKENEFLFNQTSELSEERKLKIISDGLERRIGLPPLKEMEEKKAIHEEVKNSFTNNKSRAQPKKPRRIKYEVDEYDLEYYQ